MEATTNPDTNLDANVATVAQWVSDASAGLLTATYERGLVNHSLVIKMADASPFHDDTFPGATVTGVQVTCYVPTYSKLDRRNRTTMREVHDAVRMILCGYLRPDVDDLDAFSALANFARRNRLKG